MLFTDSPLHIHKKIQSGIVTSESSFHKACEYFDVVPARSDYNSLQKRSILYQENKINDLLRDKFFNKYGN